MQVATSPNNPAQYTYGPTHAHVYHFTCACALCNMWIHQPNSYPNMHTYWPSLSQLRYGYECAYNWMIRPMCHGAHGHVSSNGQALYLAPIHPYYHASPSPYCSPHTLGSHIPYPQAAIYLTPMQPYTLPPCSHIPYPHAVIYLTPMQPYILPPLNYQWGMVFHFQRLFTILSALLCQ